jgi:hypothetical protein
MGVEEMGSGPMNSETPNNSVPHYTVHGATHSPIILCASVCNPTPLSSSSTFSAQDNASRWLLWQN